MKHKIFIDGREGTTGLEIDRRLAGMDGIELLEIAPDKRKDPAERGRLLNSADVAFLCLPDEAARESVSLVTNPNTRIIDASTAHRTSPEWDYGIPELFAGAAEAIKKSKRVAVAGCYATGFALLMRPLVDAGIIPPDYPATCHAVSGYSGGGKKLIGMYEGDEKSADMESPRLYALGLAHKHLPEMRMHSGLSKPPLFTPMVCDYYKGMTVCCPILPRLLPGNTGAQGIWDALERHYRGQKYVKVMPFGGGDTLDGGFLGATRCNDTNNAELYVFGDGENVLLTAVLDNLGKGASGAAVQCMGLMLENS